MSFSPPGRRLWRRLAWAAAGALALGVAGLAVLRAPAVQTRLVRWAVTGEGWRFDVARVSMGIAGGEASGLIFAMPGMEALAEPGLELRVRPGRFLFGGRVLHIERAAASGIRIVVTPSEMKPSATPYAGVLAVMKSPLPWVLGEAKLDAEVEVRDGGTDLATARMSVAGGGLAAARPGEFAYELEVASRLLPPGPDSQVRSKGVVKVTQSSDNGVANIELRGDLRLPDYGPLKVPAGELVLRVERTAAGERYSGGVVWGGAAEMRFAAEFDRKGRKIRGETTGEADVAVVAWAGLDPAAWPKGRGRWKSNFEIGVDDANVAARLVAGLVGRPDLLVAEARGFEAAEVELRALPLAWLGRWTDKLGLRFEAASAAAGKWRVEREGVAGMKIETMEPLVLGPVKYEDGLAPALPAARIEVNLGAKVTAERAEWELRGLRVVADNAEKAEARVTAHASWNLAKGGGEVTAARAEWRERGDSAEPVLAWTLGEPLKVDATGKPRWGDGAVLGRFAVKDFSLAGLSRWAGGKVLAGRWARGAGLVKATDAAGGLGFQAEDSWRFEDLRVAKAGAKDRAGPVLFAGDIALRPEVARSGAGLWSGRVAELRVAETSGRVISGEVEGIWNESDGDHGGRVELRAELPAGSLAPEVIGPLAVELKARAAMAAPKVGQIDGLALVVARAETNEELASVRSDGGGWLYVRRAGGEVVLNSLGPWRLKVAAMPLAWAKECLPPELELSGDLQPFECMLLAEIGKYKVRPTKPLEVRNLTVNRGGEELLREARVAFYPGLDLRVVHTFKPEFQIVWEGEVHATDGLIEGSAGRAFEWELATGFVGSPETTLPKTIDLVARGDFAAWRGVAPTLAAQLPTEGKFATRIDGDLLGADPVAVWTRIEGVPGAEPGRVLMPLEVSARGKVDGRKREANFDVALEMGEGAQAGDLAFAVKLALGDVDKTLRVDSALRGRRWDLTETLAWASAWSGAPAERAPKSDIEAKKAEVVASGEGSKANVTTPLGSAVWGALRGRFDLEVGELLMAPYRVEKLRGRIELEERLLAVSDLGGEMFAGRLGGAFTLAYEPGAEGGDHALEGAFRIEQFDTARVVQEVFPNEYGLLDARVNLRAGVHGRGFRLRDLVERAEADFSVDGKGVARLTHPDARTASTLLVMGGVLTLSPELRALGRLLRKFAEMPVDDLRIEGGRTADGSLKLSQVRFNSPQARLEGEGEVAAMDGVPLPARPLSLQLGLSAKDETGVILGRMKLLEKKADADGFRKLTQPIKVRGEAAKPDASELYDLLARGAAGSRGTWGLIMRKVQRELEKQQAKAEKEAKEAQAKS